MSLKLAVVSRVVYFRYYTAAGTRAFCILYILMCLIPLAAQVKVWVCGCSPVGIAGSNPAWGIGVCLV